MVKVEFLVVALCLYPLALLPYLILVSKYQRLLSLEPLKQSLAVEATEVIQRLSSENQTLKEQYQSREHLIESLFLEVKKGKLTFPEKQELVQYESQQWQSGYPTQQVGSGSYQSPKDPTMQVWAQSHYNSEEPNR
jgi:hypothetical protein